LSNIQAPKIHSGLKALASREPCPPRRPSSPPSKTHCATTTSRSKRRRSALQNCLSWSDDHPVRSAEGTRLGSSRSPFGLCVRELNSLYEILDRALGEKLVSYASRPHSLESHQGQERRKLPRPHPAGRIAGICE